jgi:hypothetical protein
MSGFDIFGGDKNHDAALSNLNARGRAILNVTLALGAGSLVKNGRR